MPKRLRSPEANFHESQPSNFLRLEWTTKYVFLSRLLFHSIIWHIHLFTHQNIALWHQLAAQLMEHVCPRDPLKIPNKDLPRLDDMKPPTARSSSLSMQGRNKHTHTHAHVYTLIRKKRKKHSTHTHMHIDTCTHFLCSQNVRIVIKHLWMYLL